MSSYLARSQGTKGSTSHHISLLFGQQKTFLTLQVGSGKPSLCFPWPFIWVLLYEAADTQEWHQALANRARLLGNLRKLLLSHEPNVGEDFIFHTAGDCQMTDFSGNHSISHKVYTLAQQLHYYVFSSEKLKYMSRDCTCVLKAQHVRNILKLETQMFPQNTVAKPTHKKEY